MRHQITEFKRHSSAAFWQWRWRRPRQKPTTKITVVVEPHSQICKTVSERRELPILNANDRDITYYELIQFVRTCLKRYTTHMYCETVYTQYRHTRHFSSIHIFFFIQRKNSTDRLCVYERAYFELFYRLHTALDVWVCVHAKCTFRRNGRKMFECSGWV